MHNNHESSSVVKSIPVYTILVTLIKMRHQLGLEAMIEYMEKYLGIIEANNPQLKEAVSKALSLINIEKVYHDALEK